MSDQALAEGHLLVVLIDLHPVWWAEHSLSSVLQSALLLANSHLLHNPLNRLAVYGYLNTGVYKLHPDPEALSSVSGESGDGKFEGFDMMNMGIVLKVKDLILGCEDPDDFRQLDGSMLSGAIMKALCYCNSETKSLAIGNSLTARILVLQGSPDPRAQYMGLMNGIFAAQKNKIAIDACVLGEDSTFLQQACEITGGSYVRVTEHSHLTQYLLSVFLMGVEFRSSFNIPPPSRVDFRAACQCHSKMTDIGYVCSVCMSVFCTFRPICLTCSAHFKLPAALTKGKRGTGKKKTAGTENGKP